MGTGKTELDQKRFEGAGIYAGPTEMRVISVVSEKNNSYLNRDINNYSRLLRHGTKPGCEGGIYQRGESDCRCALSLVLFSCSR